MVTARLGRERQLGINARKGIVTFALLATIVGGGVKFGPDIARLAGINLPGSSGPAAPNALKPGQVTLGKDQLSGQSVYFTETGIKGQKAEVPPIPGFTEIPLGENWQPVDPSKEPVAGFMYVKYEQDASGNQVKVFGGIALPGSQYTDIHGKTAQTFDLSLTPDGLSGMRNDQFFQNPDETLYILPLAEVVSNLNSSNNKFAVADTENGIMFASSNPVDIWSTINPLLAPQSNPNDQFNRVRIQAIGPDGKPMVNSKGKPVFVDAGTNVTSGVFVIENLLTGKVTPLNESDLVGSNLPNVRIVTEYRGPDLANTPAAELETDYTLSTPGAHQVTVRQANGTTKEAFLWSYGGLNNNGTPNAEYMTPAKGFDYRIVEGVIKIVDLSTNQEVGQYVPFVNEIPYGDNGQAEPNSYPVGGYVFNKGNEAEAAKFAKASGATAGIILPFSPNSIGNPSAQVKVWLTKDGRVEGVTFGTGDKNQYFVGIDAKQSTLGNGTVYYLNPDGTISETHGNEPWQVAKTGGGESGPYIFVGQ